MKKKHEKKEQWEQVSISDQVLCELFRNENCSKSLEELHHKYGNNLNILDFEELLISNDFSIWNNERGKKTVALFEQPSKRNIHHNVSATVIIE